MSRQDDIKKLITTYNRRLQVLEEQRALQGISVDPKILMEIEDISVQISELETELAEIKLLKIELGLEDIEEQSLRVRTAELEAENRSLNNLISELRTFRSIGNSSNLTAINDLGKGIRIGGLYRNVPLKVFATDWEEYGNGWVKSGWLYMPRRTEKHAIAFFKVHTFQDGNGYIHILDSANPIHIIWLQTDSGFSKEQAFCWSGEEKSLRTDLWKFTWR